MHIKSIWLLLNNLVNYINSYTSTICENYHKSGSRRPRDYESPALTTELQAQCLCVNIRFAKVIFLKKQELPN